MTYYELLEVREDSSAEVIKMAYKALVRKYHPDVYSGSPESSTELMAAINEAYTVLSNEEQRRAYDAQLRYERMKSGSNAEPDIDSVNVGWTDNEEVFYPDENGNTKTISMKWFIFYSKPWMAFNAIGFIIVSIMSIARGDFSGLFSQALSFGASVYIMVTFLASVLSLVAYIYLFVNLRKFTPRAFWINKVFLILTPIYISLNNSVFPEHGTLWSNFIIHMIPQLIFYFLNIIYFEKRRFLFHSGNRNYDVTKNVLKNLVIIVVISFLSVSWVHSLIGDPLIEEETSSGVVTYEFDRLAEYYGYDDRHALLDWVTDDCNDGSFESMNLRDKYVYIATEYLGAPSYDDAFGETNPYNDIIIDSFGDYQKYIYRCVKESE